MQKITLAVATAAAMITAAPLLVGSIPAKAENLKMAQAGVEVQIGRDRDEGVRRDRDERIRRDRRDENSDVTIGISPRGVVVGPREHCRTVRTTVERDDGRRVSRTERRCD
jgi:hypothetical protein